MWPWLEGLLHFHLPEMQERQLEDVVALFPHLPGGTPGEVFRQVPLTLGRVCMCIEERDEVPWAALAVPSSQNTLPPESLMIRFLDPSKCFSNGTS